MVLSEVLSVACDGAGISLAGLKSSPVYLRTLEQLRADGKDPFLDQMRAAGPLAVGSALTLGTLDREPQRRPDQQKINPEILATLVALDAALIKAGAECLPAEFPYPAGYDADPVSLSLPTTKRRLVEIWRFGKPEQRIQVALLLAQTFKPRGGSSRTVAEDIADQPDERVLPKRCGVWQPGSDSNRANCVMKDLMVSGFGLLTGDPMLIVSPLRFTFTPYAENVETAASAILNWCSAQKLKLSTIREESLQRWREYGASEAARITGQHMAVAFPLDTRRWILIDPNMGLASEIPSEWNFPQLHSTFEQLVPAVPGVSATLVRSSGEYDYGKHSADVFAALESAAPLAALHASGSISLESLLQSVGNTRTADSILQWDEFSLTAACAVRPEERALRLLAYFAAKNFCMFTPPSSAFRQDKESLLRALQDLPREQLLKLLETYLYRFVTRGLSAMQNAREEQRLLGTLMHSAVQVAPPGCAFSFAVLRHIAGNMGNAAYNSLMEELYGYGLDQFYLWGALGGRFRGAQYPEWMTAEAARIASALPARLRSIDILLRAANTGVNPAAPPGNQIGAGVSGSLTFQESPQEMR